MLGRISDVSRTHVLRKSQSGSSLELPNHPDKFQIEGANTDGIIPSEIEVRLLSGHSIKIKRPNNKEELIENLFAINTHTINLRAFSHQCLIGEKIIYSDFSNITITDIQIVNQGGLTLIPNDPKKSETLNKIKAGKFKTPVDMQYDKVVVMAAVKQNGRVLRFASQELQRDREVVMEAVKQNGMVLSDASQELQRDREVVMEAVKENGWALSYASQELQRDRDVVMEAVKQNGRMLSDASQELQGDKEVVMEAVEKCGFALEFASETLRGDRDVVMAAVKQDGEALAFASDELKKDRDIVKAAIAQCVFAWTHVSNELKQDKHFMRTLPKSTANHIRKYQTNSQPCSVQ